MWLPDRGKVAAEVSTVGMSAGAQTSTAPAEQLARHQRAGAVVGQELEQDRVRHLPSRITMPSTPASSALMRVFQENVVKFERHVDADVRSAAPEVRVAAE
jgi:hypothetical protein